MSLSDHLKYRRGDYEFELPKVCLYTMNHYWFNDLGNGLYRCGFTHLVGLSMGETIDFEVITKSGEQVIEYDVLGWIESMKAQNDLYAPMSGAFLRHNPHLDVDLDALVSDPMGTGWLYEIRGNPPAHAFSVDDYIQHLETCFTNAFEEKK